MDDDVIKKINKEMYVMNIMNNNQEKLRAQYFAASEEYAREYQKYLDLKYSKSAGDEAKAAEVYARLQSVDSKLKTLLDQVKSNESDIGNQLLDTNSAIERKTFLSRRIDVDQLFFFF